MTWTATDPRWRALNPYQRAAAMALMEADGMDTTAARNALGAMINRAMRTGADLGEHVGQRIYQPAIEPAQQARLDRIVRSPAFSELTGWAERRHRGQEADPVQGATHFLAPERTMLALEAQNPQKYRSWRQWTGFDPASNQYRGVIMRDASHAFLAPEGSYSVPAKPIDESPGDPTGTVTRTPSLTPPSASPMVASANPGVPASPTLQSAIVDAVFGRGSGAGAQQPQQQKSADIPQPGKIPQAPDPRSRVDIKRLLAIVNNRSKLGV
jgi:hypothetical protein